MVNNLQIEEYKTIRNEMLERFKESDKLLYYTIGSIGLIIAWLLSLSPGNVGVVDQPFIYIGGSWIVLVLVLYNMYSHYSTTKLIYIWGTYLAIFHELDNKEYIRFHLLNRFKNDIINSLKDRDNIKEKENLKKVELIETWGFQAKSYNKLFILLSCASIIVPIIIFFFLKNPSLPIERIFYALIIFIISLSGGVLTIGIGIRYLNRLNKKLYSEELPRWVYLKKGLSESGYDKYLSLEKIEEYLEKKKRNK